MADQKAKNVLPQTVHNELIKDARFVLVGRGTYALSEWGYKPGTVKDVMVQVLRENGNSMDKEEIIKKTLDQRQVKESTILLNLQDRNHFEKDKGGAVLCHSIACSRHWQSHSSTLFQNLRKCSTIKGLRSGFLYNSFYGYTFSSRSIFLGIYQGMVVGFSPFSSMATCQVFLALVEILSIRGYDTKDYARA